MAKMDTTKLAQNRAEEFGNDVWGNYVIPPFYNKLDLLDTKKPRIIKGGRGCGKTMLLRYLCFDSVFSLKKPFIEKQDFSNVGIYWKINTQISGLLKGRDIPEEVWLNAFQHYAVIVISRELLRFLKLIDGKLLKDSKIELQLMNFTFASDYLAKDIHSLDGLNDALNSSLRKFNLWIANVHNVEVPIFLSKGFLDDLIEQIRIDQPYLNLSNFYIYIDEFENLEPFQKPLINTWLKHSSCPLIFNIAMKKGIEMGDTMGEENIVDIHDYRIHDIEDYLSDDVTYKTFAAEILFLRLGEVTEEPFKSYKKMLVDPVNLEKRTDKVYAELLLPYVEKIFPSISYKNISKSIFDTPSLRNRFNDLVETLDGEVRKSFKELINSEFSEAMLVTPFILKRAKSNNNEVLAELNQYCNGKKSKFSAPTDWIKNNLVAAILYIYDSSQNMCPIFSGFETFCKISHGNIRYLLELCYKSLQNAADEAARPSKELKIMAQSAAAKNASYSFLNEIRRLGKKGNLLYLFAFRLGLIFKMAGKNPLLSEPEINHFSIKNYKEGTNQEIDDFLIEAVKWSVLYKNKSNKLKNQTSSEDFDYILNPIYSPFFNISFRKIRKLEIEKTQFLLLLKGNEEEFQFLLKNYQKRWNLSRNLDTLNLFDI